MSTPAGTIGGPPDRWELTHEELAPTGLYIGLSITTVRDPSEPIAQLLFRGRSGWSPLPDWARFMLSTGARVANARPAEGRLVVALSIPVRAFASALASASAVVSAFRDGSGASDAAHHFDYLASLPPGTAITHHRANSIQQGRLLGVEGGRIRIKLRTEQRLLPVRLCREIQVIDDPGTLKVRKQKLVKHPEFLSRALPGLDVASLSAATRLDCVIVGVQDLLEEELLASSFGAGLTDGRVYEGSLQSIVRARDVGGTKDAYRSMIVPASSADGETPSSAVGPRVAVFDGARAFNNWRSVWPDANWLVLIDRGSPSAEEGAATIVQEYATRVCESDALAGLELPAGIEVLSYVVRR